LEVSPSKRQVNIALSNQSALSGVNLVLIWYYCGIVLVISLFLCCFSLIISVMNTILYLEYYKWYQSTFLDKKLWVNFFSRVETYSNVLKLQRSVITCINPRSGIHTHMKYKWYLSAHLLATLVTHVSTLLSGSASENTCIHIDLDLLKPSIDKPIGRLTAIVPPRTTLRNILSSTFVVG
jgi:hypothetical protein